MFEKLGPAISRALTATRAANPLEATRIIQQALNGQPAGEQADSVSDAPRIGQQPQSPKRKSLGETLAALRNGVPMPRHAVLEPALPDGAAFLKRRQDSVAGSRDYRLYVPTSGRPRGLVVMLHGCKQSAEDFAVSTMMNIAAEAEQLMVAYPAQVQSANPSACWNWFNPEDQQRGKGEPAIIAEMTRTIISDYGLDESRVFVAGLSAGGAMAAVMAATYPELYEAAGIHSGIAYRAAHDVPSAFAAMRGSSGAQHRPDAGPGTSARQIIFQGSRDHTVAPSNAEILFEKARLAHRDTRAITRSFEGGSRTIKLVELIGQDGTPKVESWLIDGAGHHWSGGDPQGSYAKREGPHASREMVRFFMGRPAED